MFQQVAANPTNGVKLAVFRIAYCLVLLLEVKQLFFFRSLIFYESINIPLPLLTGLLLFWSGVLLLLLLGWFTRWAAILNYILGVLVVWQMPAFKYHLDFIMTTVNFLLLFLPVSQTFSVDEYQTKKQFSEKPQLNRISDYNIWLLVLAGLGLVYIDSAIQKLDSPMWRAGLGFWWPSSLPVNVITNFSWLLNSKVPVQIIGYGILVFEIIFIFLVWIRPFRGVLIFFGILMHVGIAVLYPIPHFALLMFTLYIPLLPDSIWQPLISRYKNKIPPAISNAEVTRAETTKVGINRKWAFILGGYFCLGQLMCISVAPFLDKAINKSSLEQLMPKVQWAFRPLYFFNQKFLGIVSHDIFLDKHFSGYQYIINIRYVSDDGQAVWLPLYRTTGQPAAANTGRIWTKWAYRVTGPQPEKERFKDGVRNFTSFWARQNKIRLDKGKFEIWRKKITDTQGWEKDFLNKQIQQPWEKAGFAQWRNNQMELQVIDLFPPG